MPKRINIAIDGFSACGKSTLAQALAGHLDYLYIDSGAMYRAVTLYAIRQGLTGHSIHEIVPLLVDITIKCRWLNRENKIFLNEEDVSELIRFPEIQNLVSPVSAIPEVRKNLVDQQRIMAMNKGVVMDGRDIGTVVLPQAELKIFMTADALTRAWRRKNEMDKKGIHLSLETIMENLLMRDKIDSSRLDSPLKKADDAIILDNSDLNETSQFNLALSWVLEIINRP